MNLTRCDLCENFLEGGGCSVCEHTKPDEEKCDLFSPLPCCATCENWQLDMKEKNMGYCLACGNQPCNGNNICTTDEYIPSVDIKINNEEEVINERVPIIRMFILGAVMFLLVLALIVFIVLDLAAKRKANAYKVSSSQISSSAPAKSYKTLTISGKCKKAYKENLQFIIDKYGRFVVDESNLVSGLQFAELVDFENDKQPELLVYYNGIVELYRFNGEYSDLIYSVEVGPRYGQGEGPSIFTVNNGSYPCILTYHSRNTQTSESITIFTLKSGIKTETSMSAVGYGGELTSFYDNHVSVTKEEYENKLNTIYENSAKIVADNVINMEKSPGLTYPTATMLDDFLGSFGIKSDNLYN